MRISYWSSDVCSSDLSFATGVQTRHLDGDAGDPGPALRSDQGRGSGRGLSPTADVTPMAVVPPTAVVTGPTSGQSAPEREEGRSEGDSVGRGWGRTRRCGGSRDNEKKKTNKNR